MLRGVPDKWGPKYQADDGAVTRSHAEPDTIKYTASVHMALVLLTPQPDREVALNSDRRTVGVAPAGSLEIIPASAEIFARWKVEKQSLLVAIDPGRLARLAGAEFDKECFEFHPPQLGVIDRHAHALAQSMRYELENLAPNFEECLDALITLFAIHLLRNHSSLKPRSSPSLNGGLPPAAWRKVNDFIQAHLGETLSLERLASIANLSPSHFARAFKQTVGQAPHGYVVASRLSRARELIINTDTPLSQIAGSVGFANHSHMTMRMKDLWGTTPAEYRRERGNPAKPGTASLSRQAI
ncbi:helix-turn-helix domain-containing protein [Labrys sp. La1]|uniref:helix-turn-helix domain-containing protein n=1 Tax=Labrys sp. La1 TaxID=3404917 RepID=UPI003EBE0A79